MKRVVAVLGLLVCFTSPAAGQPGAQPLAVAEGDGVRMEVFAFDRGQVSGRFFTDGQYVPFTGTMTTQGAANVIQGTFDYQGQAYPFTTQQADASTVNLTIAGDVYAMRVRAVTPAPAPAPQPEPGRGVTPGPTPASSAERVEFRRHTFADPTTGVDEAYTLWAPSDWQVQGHVAWSEGKFPMPTFTGMVRSPHGESVVYAPGVGGVHAPGLTQTPPPPRDVARYVADHMAQHVGPARVVEAVREPEREKATLAAWSRVGIPQRPGRQLQAWRVTLSYQEQGVAMRLDTPVLLVTNPAQGAVVWNLSFAYIVTGPEATYDQRKGLLFAVANSATTTPTWFHVRHATLAKIKAMNDRADAQAWMEISRRGHEMRMRDIHGWGQTALQVMRSDAGVRQRSFESWRQQQQSSDWGHNQQLKMLHGVKDYQTVGGQRIALPQQYGYVYQSRSSNTLVVSTKPVVGPEAQGMEQLLPATGRPE
ncbi:MAG: hypothetical protein AAGA57_08285 [Planctomycetota bacterium]